MHAELLLIDETAGSSPERAEVAGTLSVLDEADQAGLVSFDQAVAQLQKTSFRVSQAVLSEIMQKPSR
jgi:predicted nucleic acid-binding protein